MTEKKPSLDLYVYAGCPFCTRVISFLDSSPLKMDRDFRLFDTIQDPTAYAKLMEVGGKDQVPFLIHGQKSMYESGDIIEYVKKLIQ
jgi:glutaredoxin 2